MSYYVTALMSICLLVSSTTLFAQVGGGSSGLPADDWTPPNSVGGAVDEPGSAPQMSLQNASGNAVPCGGVAAAAYKIGITGWATPTGVYIRGVQRVRDYNQGGIYRYPAKEMMTHVGGPAPIKMFMERGDRIVSVGGLKVKSPTELIVAIHASPTPHSTEVRWINFRDGKEYISQADFAQVSP